MKHIILVACVAFSLLGLGTSAVAWDEQNCKEVNYNHPDCKTPTPTPTHTTTPSQTPSPTVTPSKTPTPTLPPLIPPTRPPFTVAPSATPTPTATATLVPPVTTTPQPSAASTINTLPSTSTENFNIGILVFVLLGIVILGTLWLRRMLTK